MATPETMPTIATQEHSNPGPLCPKINLRAHDIFLIRQFPLCWSELHLRVEERNHSYGLRQEIS